MHSVVGLDIEAVTAEFKENGIIALEDTGGALFDFAFDDIYDELGDWMEGREIIEEKYQSPAGTAYVLRDEAVVGRMQVMVMIPDAEFVCAGEEVRG